MKDLTRLGRDLDALARKAKSISNRNIGNVEFTYDEQELIRRVMKAILPQIKSNSDLTTAKSILERTEWIDA